MDVALLFLILMLMSKKQATASAGAATSSTTTTEAQGVEQLTIPFSRSGTIRGPTGEGIQTTRWNDAVINATLNTTTPNHLVSRQDGQVVFRVLMRSDRDLPGSLGYSPDRIELSIIRIEDVPEWLQAMVTTTLLNKAVDNVLSIKSAVNTQDVMLNIVTNKAMRVVRHWEPAGNGVGAATRIIERFFVWNVRNTFGERIAAGVYMVLGYIKLNPKGFIPTGWMKLAIK